MMAEKLLSTKVTIEVETNKRTIKHIIAWPDTLPNTAERVAVILALIEADLHG
jgi:hypothetical protein